MRSFLQGLGLVFAPLLGFHMFRRIGDGLAASVPMWAFVIVGGTFLWATLEVIGDRETEAEVYERLAEDGIPRLPENLREIIDPDVSMTFRRTHMNRMNFTMSGTVSNGSDYQIREVTVFCQFITPLGDVRVSESLERINPRSSIEFEIRDGTTVIDRDTPVLEQKCQLSWVPTDSDWRKGARTHVSVPADMRP